MIRTAFPADAAAVAGLAMQMWTSHSPDDLTAEFESLLQNPDAAVFLAEENGLPVGFAQCQLRRDYVEGTDSSPVGYLEGIFVRKDSRKQGHARQLLARCEAWAREQGCTEFASDCELTNTDSLRFHQKLGFTEANRIICFTKQL